MWPRLMINFWIDSIFGFIQCSPNLCLVWRSPFSAFLLFGFCIRPTIVEVVCFAIKFLCLPCKPLPTTTYRSMAYKNLLSMPLPTIGKICPMFHIPCVDFLNVDLPIHHRQWPWSISTRCLSIVPPTTVDLLPKFFCWQILIRLVMVVMMFRPQLVAIIEILIARPESVWQCLVIITIIIFILILITIIITIIIFIITRRVSTVIVVLACWSAFWSCFCSPNFRPACWDYLPAFWVRNPFNIWSTFFSLIIELYWKSTLLN